MEETAGASVYGVSFAGGGLDFSKFIRKPQTIVRLLSWLFAMVVFACITTEGYINTPETAEAKCIFNQNDSACHFAVGIGVIAFLACVLFLLLDVYLPFMRSPQERKYADMADLGFSGVWTFLWFVCFCLLASQWSHTTDIRGIPTEAANAIVAFCFFSIATWGLLTFFAVGRVRHGVDQVTIPTYTEPPTPDHLTPYPPTYAPTSYNPSTYTPTTYSVYPSSVPSDQQPPFSSKPPEDAGYQPPTY